MSEVSLMGPTTGVTWSGVLVRVRLTLAKSSGLTTLLLRLLGREVSSCELSISETSLMAELEGPTTASFGKLEARIAVLEGSTTLRLRMGLAADVTEVWLAVVAVEGLRVC